MNSTMKMTTFFTTVWAILFVLALLAADSEARPSGRISRQKRVSDQRLAELETLLALEKIRGQLVTVPVAFGRVDPAKIGRRRRSSVESGLERLQHLLEAAAEQDSQSVEQGSDESAPSLWEISQHRHQEVTDDQLV